MIQFARTHKDYIYLVLCVLICAKFACRYGAEVVSWLEQGAAIMMR